MQHFLIRRGKIQKVLVAVMICGYWQITKTSHDEEFIDPMDMEHYDQSTKSMKFTLKEKKSLELFQGLLQGLLKRAEERGLNSVMDIDIGLEINKFLNNENWDSNKMQIILENVVFTDPKDDLEQESVELFKGFLQRLLNNADERGLKAVMDIDIEMEINKFLNNENWDSDKLKIILENVAIPEDKEDWLWTLVVGGVILCILTLLMKFFYWRQPVQNEVINEAEEPEDDNDYKENQISTPTPETGQNVPNFRSEWWSDPDTEQTEKGKCPSQHLQTSHKFSQTQDEDLDESHEQQNFLSAKINRAEVTLPNYAIECTRSEIQTKPGTLQDEEDSDGAPNRNMERFGQTSFCLLSNLEKMEDKNPVKNKAPSHTLSTEKKQVVTILGAKKSTDKSNYNPELLSSDTEGSSESQVNVDTVLSTHHSQDSSMIVDDESDFIVLSENSPESLTFINVGPCDESL
ncbi:uncharacterized protein [Dendrobates tinctorius]|uniref:uncharacterized protein isoform X4 n=1 Tax=Dendrobates tinctorius TaxID=92724 RepID=UPI003CCA348C